MRISLIDISTYQANTYLHDNINDDKMNILISRVQDTYLQDKLGTDFYNDLQTKSIAGTLTNDEQTLIDDYIAPCMFVMLEMKALYEMNIDFRNLAVGKINDTQITPLTQGEISMFENNKKKELEVLERVLIDYLCDNETLFPTYSSQDGTILPAKKTTNPLHFL